MFFLIFSSFTCHPLWEECCVSYLFLSNKFPQTQRIKTQHTCINSQFLWVRSPGTTLLVLFLWSHNKRVCNKSNSQFTFSSGTLGKYLLPSSLTLLVQARWLNCYQDNTSAVKKSYSCEETSPTQSSLLHLLSL